MKYISVWIADDVFLIVETLYAELIRGWLKVEFWYYFRAKKNAKKSYLPPDMGLLSRLSFCIVAVKTFCC